MCKTRKNRSQKFSKAKLWKRYGFTLVELLITSSILGMISLAIFSTFAGGLRVYERVKTYGGVQTDVLISLEKMEKDLRNVFSLSGIDFIGDRGKVSFAGFIKTLDSEGKQKVSVGKTAYYFDTETGALVKEEQGYAHALSQMNAGEREFKVLAFIESLNFRFYYFNSETEVYGWKDSWSAEEGIPRGVEIEVSFKNGGRSVKSIRTVLIPTAG